jgi:hypothetical protein
MVDFQAYQQLHHNSTNFRFLYSTIDDPNCERMSGEVMASDEPPPEPDIYVFPNTIPGYDLRSKKWGIQSLTTSTKYLADANLVDLKVDLIQDIIWNKKSFEHLVVDNETKELIQALILHQIAREEGTDNIDRKGNGLIILLHGGPGTGKTFTVEGIAEIAQTPFFGLRAAILVLN